MNIPVNSMFVSLAIIFCYITQAYILSQNIFNQHDDDDEDDDKYTEAETRQQMTDYE